jgi:serine/threonine protein phosphatase PrpC
MITKYLGKQDLSEDSFGESEYSGDDNTLLLCTDGLYKKASDLGRFHRILNLKYVKSVKNGLDRFIKGVNIDDATYIFVRCKNVRN